MPSGAKKRKAAKRKEQEQQQLLGVHPPGSPTSTDTGPPHSPHGSGVSEEEDPTCKDSKESESGSDVASPMAQDNHQCPMAVEDTVNQAEARGKERGKKERDSAGLVDIVKVMDSTQISDKELPRRAFPLQTEEDAKETEEVHATAVEVKKDEMLPLLLLDPVPPTSAGAPVTEPETFTIEHIQCEKGEDACVPGEKSPDWPLVEHKHLEAVDIVNTAERRVPISEEQARDFLVESLKVVQNVTDAPNDTIEGRELHLSDATTEDTNHLFDCRHCSNDCEMAGTTEVAWSPKLEQRTSWLSCCGLFDVIMGVKR